MMETVLQAQQAALRHCKPQTQIGDIDHAARSIITQAGWGSISFTEPVTDWD